MRRRLLLTVAASAALVLSACSSGDSESGEAGEAAGGSGCVTDGSAPDAEPLPVGMLEPGEHTTSLLGTGVTFTTENPWEAAVSADEALALRPPEPPDVAGTQEVMVLRGAELVDGEAAGDGMDLAAWAEEQSLVDVKDRRETTVGGCDAVVVDLQATDQQPLLRTTAGTVFVRPNETARLWVVEQGEQDPLVIHASASNLDLDWLDQADAVVESMELEVAPGEGAEASAPCGTAEEWPIGAPAGQYTTQQFGDRQLTMDQFSCAQAFEPGPRLVVLALLAEDPQVGPAVLISAPLGVAGGAPLPDTSALLDAASSAGAELEEAGRMRILGQRVTGYSNVVTDIGPVTLSKGTDPTTLEFEPVDTTYPVDTAQGLVLVSAVADKPEDLPAAEKLLRQVAGSIEQAG